MSTTLKYGAPPTLIDTFELPFEEYMHYMYLPIRMPDAQHDFDVRVPRRLHFAMNLIVRALLEEQAHSWDHRWPYVYLTARRGFATPGNPLNRPGWHSDGFGTPDINYVWTDRFPTLFAEGTFADVSDDHVKSIAQFEEAIYGAGTDVHLRTYGDNILMRLDSSVIHSAPEIPAPGGERSFLKVSFSNERYNLVGNSHNYLFDYDWEMFDRKAVRNDPARAGKDAA